MRTLPLAQAKKTLSALVKDVEEKYDRFTITKKGVDKAVLLSVEEFEGMIETIDILSSAEELAGIRQADDQIRRGKTMPFETALREIERG